MEDKQIAMQLMEIKAKLPTYYSKGNAFEMKARFDSYKCIIRNLPDRYSSTAIFTASEFWDIELDINWAIKGTPQKEAESRFFEARRHLEDDINHVLNQLSNVTQAYRGEGGDQ